MSITVAEAAMARQRFDRGIARNCGMDWDLHHWEAVIAKDDNVPFAIICVHCGVLPTELLEQLPVLGFDA
jgi:hypothetical protein